eukprot:gene2067-biopygen18908
MRCPEKQTNQRAELFAFLHCLRAESRAFLFVTDSRYVHDGVEQFRARWRAKAWFKHPLLAEYIEHADLWQEVDSRLRSRPCHHVHTIWTRGHARREQAAAGETTAFLCHGNCCADRLASIGSRLPRGAAVPHPFVFGR